jgi:hypothetical protein
VQSGEIAPFWLVLIDIPQMQSKFVEIVPPFHRQGNGLSPTQSDTIRRRYRKQMAPSLPETISQSARVYEWPALLTLTAQNGG